MHTIDIIFAIVSLIFLVIGIKKGFISEISHLIAMIAGLVIAFLYYNELYTFIGFLRHIPRPVGPAISFAILYALTMLVIILIGWILKHVVNLTPFGFIDRILGGAIGLAKAAIVAWVVCLSLSTFSKSKSQNGFHNSYTYKTFEHLPSWVKVESLTKARASFKQLLEKDTVKKVEDVGDKITTLKAKVDSVKAAKDSKGR